MLEIRGHLRSSCPLGEDYSGLCFRCGGSDHVARNCNVSPDVRSVSPKEGIITIDWDPTFVQQDMGRRGFNLPFL
ncbi:gag protein [Lasius niger]|uniref:Gag protein n=1 Tax=Lasius niger TaxID=67767 RepID=A0A0J7KMP4_LASNI|nr:gag protein [Lasius niger]